MKSFTEYLMEITADPDTLDSISVKKPSIRYSKLIPKDVSKTIPIKLSYAVYNVFKRYVSPKYELANNLLDRRGDSVSWVTVKASNEEIFNLRELAKHIITNAPEFSANRPDYTNQEREIAVAKWLIDHTNDILGEK